jgi:hypothetical protein
MRGLLNKVPRQFVITAVVVATTVLAIGWATGLRVVMHGALLSVAVAAFLPFVIIAVVLFVILVLGLVAAASGEAPVDLGGVDGGASFIEGGFHFIPIYYRFLARQRHPLFWGTPVGTLLGGLLLWGLLGALVIPGEMRTVQILGEAKTQIDQAYAKNGRFPAAEDGKLIEGGQTVVDGFGRPLHYAVSGKWKLASYRLASAGYDGEESGDDLCVAGASGLMKLVSVAAAFSDRLAGIRALRCTER